MVEEEKSTNPVMAKANELAEALMASQEYKEKNETGLTLLIAECNLIIASETRVDYGSLGRSSCC